MAKLFQQIRVGTITGDTIAAKTGKAWNDWCKILDQAGARMMDHKEIVLLLETRQNVSRWWGQVIAAGYEKERGLRQDDTEGRRYDVTLSKIVNAPRETAWAAWHDPAVLERWLPAARFEVSKSVPHKLLQLEWSDETYVEVKFYERRGKTRVVVAHGKLAEDDTERRQRYWSDALDRLRVLMVG